MKKNEEKAKRILLVYPQMGMAGALVQHMPLSLLYAAVDALKTGFEVDIVDVRLCGPRWENRIASQITSDTILLGISVMSGAPIHGALQISQWSKRNYPKINIVWGGPHATFNGKEVLENHSIDFVISGYGTKPLSQLAKHIANDGSSFRLADIPGLIYRENKEVLAVVPENKFEIIHFRDIPYYLIAQDMEKYGQLDMKERIFPMYSVMGCPYKCAFCSSPAQYKDMKRKYEFLPPAEVADHIEFVYKRYGATYIYFIDDDSFVNLDHVEAIIDEIQKRKILVRMGFRGARIDEIKRMNGKYLNKLADAGTNILHIGAESGSQRILDLIHKNCSVEDIIEVNQKMARHPAIKTAYNWIVGLPGETLDDLRKTRKLMTRLVEENPNAIIFMPNKYRPLPGTELYELAVKHGYRSPKRIEDWVEMEAEGDFRPPWISNDLANAIHMMQVTSFFIDNKINKINAGKTFKFLMVRLLALLYSPIAKLRFKWGISDLLVEYRLFYWFTSSFRL